MMKYCDELYLSWTAVLSVFVKEPIVVLCYPTLLQDVILPSFLT